MNDKIPIPTKWLIAHDACSPAMTYLEAFDDFQTAWEQSVDGTHLAWLCDNVGIDPTRLLQIQIKMLDTPLGDGRVVEDLLSDPRIIKFVALKRRKLAGEIISAEAWDAAWSAARSAGTEAYAAASWSARADADADVDVAEAYSAAYAARSAAYSDAAWSAWASAVSAAFVDEAEADVDAAKDWQATAIREIVPLVPVPKLGE